MLRSAKILKGLDISARDGELGEVEELIVDDEDWTIRYMVVDTGRWLPGRKVIISPQWISEKDMAQGRVVVDLSQSSVRNSPVYDPDTLDRDYEDRLYEYYGREKYWLGRRRAA